MPVGLSAPERLLPVAGVRWGTACAGVRQSRRDDLAVMEWVPGSRAAAVFTQNRFCAAPVAVAREHLQAQIPRALVVNSGNANAGTGAGGHQDAKRVCQALATTLNLSVDQVLPFSTGVIGERLPVDRLVQAVDVCVQRLRADGWLDAAAAIMTTDTVLKGGSRQVEVHGRTVTLTGITKGAGMIRPDMATMLAYIATDAVVDSELLQQCLHEAVEHSFNRITVEGDTSTNDACVLVATNAADHQPLVSAADPHYRTFKDALLDLTTELAQAIIRDAEGATKFIELDVRGGATEADCLSVAYTVAHSPLVKTAFFASDPNWGRILAAIGRAEVANLDITRVSVKINDLDVVVAGEVAPAYTEDAGQAVMACENIVVSMDLGMGAQHAVIWTSDLSNEYVRINAEYRT